MPNPYDPAVDAVSRGMLDPSVLSPAQHAMLVAAPPAHGLPIDLVEPDAPEPAGDRLPCHLFADEVDWPTAAEAVLRADKPVPPHSALPPMPSEWLGNPPACPPCTGRCHQGRACPTAPWPVREFEATREALAAAKVRHRRLSGRLFLALALGWLGMGLLLLALP